MGFGEDALFAHWDGSEGTLLKSAQHKRVLDTCEDALVDGSLTVHDNNMKGKSVISDRNYQIATGFIGLVLIGAMSYMLVLILNKLKDDSS
jgi:hypothetical protein